MKYSCKGDFFVDGYGRARMFRGINYVDKSVVCASDGLPRYHFNIPEEQLEKLAARGMNIMRLGLTWAGVQPQKDIINYAYLDGVKAAVKQCAKYGIECYIDFHQDLYSPFVSSGDGAPEFACVKPKGMKPKKTIIIWAEDYFINPFVQKSFDKFWDGGGETQKAFLYALKKTAEYLSDCEIFAYDVLNEPFPGTPGLAVAALIAAGAVNTFFNNPKFDRGKFIKNLLSGNVFEALSVADDPSVMAGIVCPAAKIIKKFDEEKYVPFLKRAEKTLREAGYDGIIFTDNCYFSNLGIPTGLTKISDKTAFSPHGYDVTVDTPLTNTASPCRVDFIFDEHKRTQERLGVPVLVGEWGGMVPGADDYPALRHLVEKFEKNYWSFTYWHYFDNIADSKIGQTLAGSYPVAVAGTPKKFEKTPGRFALSYSGDALCGGDTVIYFDKKPEKIYSTAPYTLNGSYLTAEQRDGECVIIAEF